MCKSGNLPNCERNTDRPTLWHSFKSSSSTVLYHYLFSSSFSLSYKYFKWQDGYHIPTIFNSYLNLSVDEMNGKKLWAVKYVYFFLLAYMLKISFQPSVSAWWETTYPATLNLLATYLLDSVKLHDAFSSTSAIFA